MNLSTMLLACVVVLLASVANSYSFSKVFAIGNKISHQQNPQRNTLCMTSSSDNTSPSIFDWFQKLLSSFTNGGSSSSTQVSTSAPEPAPKQPKSAVLMFGGSGRAGQEIVKSIALSNNKDVILANRKSAEEGSTVISQLLGFEAVQKSDHLFPRFNVDVTDSRTLTSEVFEGAESIVSCIGPSFKEARLNAEAVDFNGNLNLIAAAKQYLGSNTNLTPKFSSVYNFDKSSRNISQWVRLDDVIMGGRSQSQWSAVDWAGEGVRTDYEYNFFLLINIISALIFYSLHRQSFYAGLEKLSLTVVDFVGLYARTTCSKLTLQFMTASYFV